MGTKKQTKKSLQNSQFIINFAMKTYGTMVQHKPKATKKKNKGNKKENQKQIKTKDYESYKHSKSTKGNWSLQSSN
ncbi:Uncharacterised protein [Prevotella disiens]|uniref:Uncharacterized protein n=1 Tax=Prevotella disiens TaxID=28130 RepID=A0A379EG36_9BACT|nr:hypothetical protein [Prevotella disiens]SUB97602.1 Uncharacterised protein [Prevotella disiens]